MSLKTIKVIIILILLCFFFHISYTYIHVYANDKQFLVTKIYPFKLGMHLHGLQMHIINVMIKTQIDRQTHS